MKVKILPGETLDGRRIRVVMMIAESEEDRKQLIRDQKKSGRPVIEGFAPEGTEIER